MSNRAQATVTELEVPTTRAPFDFPPNTDKVDYAGVTYNFRELTVAETDECRENSIINEKFDGRLMTRLMISKAATDPKMALGDIGKLPQGLYSAIVDCVNDLNDPEALKDVPPGNS